MENKGVGQRARVWEDSPVETQNTINSPTPRVAAQHQNRVWANNSEESHQRHSQRSNNNTVRVPQQRVPRLRASQPQSLTKHTQEAVTRIAPKSTTQDAA